MNIEHLEQFISFGRNNFQSGSLLFGAEFLEDALKIAEELLAIKKDGENEKQI